VRELQNERGRSKLGRRNRKDKVTVSFHYLTRAARDAEGEPTTVPITVAEFKEAIDGIINTPEIDTSTQDGVDKLRFSTIVPIKDLIELEPNLYFGTYTGIYTGHTYQNTAKGEIPYDSASLRNFSFLVYWSKPKGRVYIATQYLGQFGDYTGLKTTIIRAFEDTKGIESHSFRNTSEALHKVKAKEISIEYMQSSTNAGSANSFGNIATIVLKRSGDGLEFADAARKRLFSILDGPKDKIKSEVAKILKENKLTSVSDNDILNCTVLAEVDGSERRYYFINDSSFATHFQVSVGMDIHGHPDVAQLQKAMRRTLKDEILSKSENV
jgi:hypothetical protein